MPFVDVTLSVGVRRHSVSYQMTMIIPCALLSSLVYLGFILPPESGERIGLSITVLLAVTVFQEMTSQIMPPFDFPFLAQYYLATIFQTAFSLIVTTVILNFYHRTDREMPWLVKLVILKWMHSALFCMSKKSEEKAARYEKRDRTPSNAKTNQRPDLQKRSFKENNILHNSRNNNTDFSSASEDETTIKEELSTIRTQFQHMRKLSDQYTHATEKSHQIQIEITEPNGRRFKAYDHFQAHLQPDGPGMGKSTSTPDMAKIRRKSQLGVEYHSDGAKAAVLASSPNLNSQRGIGGWRSKRRPKSERTAKSSDTKFAIGASLKNTAFVLLGEKAGEQGNGIYAKRTNEEKEEIRKQRIRDWTVAARVLDRFFLILFVITSNAMLFWIFFRAP